MFFVVVCWLFFQNKLFREILLGTPSESQMDWIQIIWSGSKLFDKVYKQTTKFTASRWRVNNTQEKLQNATNWLSRRWKHLPVITSGNSLPTYVMSSADKLWKLVWTQIRPDKSLGLIWFQTVWHSDGIPWPIRIFTKSWFLKKSADDK